MKKIIIIVIIFLIVYYRYDFTSTIMSGFGYKSGQSHKVAQLVSDDPVNFLNSKIFNIVERLKKNDLESHLDSAIMVRKDFSKNEHKNIYSNKQEVEFYKENNHSVIDNKTKKPIFQWSHRMDSKRIVESEPKICGDKLIYAVPEGNITALDYKTGEKIWTKVFKGYAPFARRGFACKYNALMDINIIYIPTSIGVLCLDSESGDFVKSICNNGVIKSYKSLIPPIIDKDRIYIATVSPSGVEARDINNGSLLWRTEFEVDSSFLSGGSNPWSGFTYDKKSNIIFVNTGSPSNWTSYKGIDSKFKYSNSLIALSSKDGSMLWQFQERSQDYWDSDMVSKPIISPVKIDNKEIVITLSKSGSIYFLDKNTGKSVFELIERKTNIGGLSYFIKESIKPKSLLFSSILNTQCNGCNKNTKIENYLPPILKKIRKFDGYSGGLQWPGGDIDSSNKLLIVSSNRNLITEHYYDFVPFPAKNISSKEIFESCFECHSKDGRVVHNEDVIYPSLFLTTKIHSLDSFKEFIKSNKFHNSLRKSSSDIEDIYSTLLDYDNDIVSKKSYQVWANVITHKPHDKKLALSAPFGLITAISLKTGEIVWQINAGTFINNNGDNILGSPNYAGVRASANEHMSVFAGSYDKSAYGIDNNNGNILWKVSLPASGSAPPYIYEKDKDRWIFIVSSGGRAPGDKSDALIAFRQNNSISYVDNPNQKTEYQNSDMMTNLEIENTLSGVYLYDNNCATCHGLKGIGTSQGPSLIESMYFINNFSNKDFLKVFESGSAQKNWEFGPMPPQFQVSKKEAKIILNYVRSFQNF